MDNSFVPTVVPKHSLLANVLGFYSSTYFLACLLVCLFNLPILVLRTIVYSVFKVLPKNFISVFRLRPS